MQLYNNLSSNERAELIKKVGKDRLTISFYKYAKIGNPQILRNHLYLFWDTIDVLGRIYIAHEGINAQLSLPAENFQAFKIHLDSISFLENVRLNLAIEQDMFSFLKLKVKVRNKIVADGLEDDTFDVTDIGTHVDANRFNELVEDEDTVLVDMRNHYESEIGHFKNAVTPDVDTFRDSLGLIENQLKDHKETKKLVMYCTGGIRCEKASAYYKHKGFKNVFHGIGMLYAKEKWLNKLPPYQGGGEMISEVTFEKTSYAGLPHKFEAGTPNVCGGIAFGAAIDYMNAIGFDKIAAYVNDHLTYATKELLAIEGLKIYGTAQNKTSVISFNIEGVHAYDLGTIVDKLGIAIRTGQHCAQPIMDFYGISGTARASFAFYNTKAEIDQLVSALKRAKKMLC